MRVTRGLGVQTFDKECSISMIPVFWQDYNNGRLRTQALGISSVAFTRSISIIAASTKMLLTCQACFVFVLHYCSAMITVAPL